MKGEVRRSQLITTYGVGAIIAVEDEAFMVAGIDRWRVDGPNIHEPRLERELRVDGFVSPPATEGGDDVPVVRFPDMYSCPECRTLAVHGHFTTFNGKECNACGTTLVPSRFVAACDKGHIEDFPYFRWVHAGTPPGRDGQHGLRLESSGSTASLADIRITCECGKSKTMDGSFGRRALSGVATCSGKRPWIGGGPEGCDELPRTLQRGASSVWFPVVRSALSIPPWSEGAFALLNRHWAILRHVEDAGVIGVIRGMKLHERSPYSAEELAEAVIQRKRREVAPEDEPLRPQEYDALLRGRPDDGRPSDFVCEEAELDAALGGTFDALRVAKRLREVRVLESFTRILPPAPTDRAERRAPLFLSHPGWLPGIEVRGEGVFIRLDETLVRAWEARPVVRTRAGRISHNYAERAKQAGAVPDRVISPRLLAVHTLAHVLINEWALDSGYPAAALRERLYVDESMAGLLIYTATSDSAGSLGGVVAQARPGALATSVRNAVGRAAWCSADPLCVEAEATGVDSLNLAACHACILLPEVSCEEMNVLLDRAMLVGTPEDAEAGLLSHLLDGGTHGEDASARS